MALRKIHPRSDAQLQYNNRNGLGEKDVLAKEVFITC